MVRSDGAAYYAYMPQWFIYGTNNFEFIPEIEKKYPQSGYEDNIENDDSGKLYNKYFCGTSVVCTPFFLIGHIHAKIKGADTDGYSPPYIFWINLASIVYGVLGILGIILIGFRLKFHPFAIYFTATAIAVATNLLYYTTAEIPYAHVFGFSINIWTLFFLLKWKDERTKGWKYLFFIFFGLAIIIRPTNFLILAFFPFVFENFKAFLQYLKDEILIEKRSMIIGITLFSLIIFIHFFNSYQQSGHWSFNNYSQEGFDNWANPYFFEILFGFNKGMFIYSPILLLIIPGMILFFWWNRYMATGFTLTFILSVYVISSWWCWWYGGSLGMRALIDFYGIYAIAMMVFIHYLSNFVKFLFIPVLIAGAYLYQTFDIQYKQNILKYDGMDYAQLKLVFLKTESRYNWILYRKIDVLNSDFKELYRINGVTDPLSRKKVEMFSFRNRHWDFFPTETIRFTDQEKQPEGDFAYRYFAQVYLHSGETYLSMNTKGFYSGEQVFETEHPYSHVPSKSNRWEDITIDVKTSHSIQKLDSVQINYNCAAHSATIRNPEIHWGIEKTGVN